MEPELTLPEVVKKARKDLKLTQEQFGAALRVKISNVKLGRQSVIRWENGEDEPNTDFLLVCVMVYSDWRMQWAIDCLCVKLPEVFEKDEHGALRTIKHAVVA